MGHVEWIEQMPEGELGQRHQRRRGKPRAGTVQNRKTRGPMTEPGDFPH